MKNRFALHLNLENAAFGEEPAREIARILRATADRMDRTGHMHGILYDVNGNNVGDCDTYTGITT